jgi:hypothetical protein
MLKLLRRVSVKRFLIGLLALLLFPGLSLAQAIAPQAVPATSGVNFRSGQTLLFGFDLTEGATAAYFAFLNVNTVPTGGATIAPLFCMYVAANGSIQQRHQLPDLFTNGLTVVSTSSCTTYTAVTPVLISVQTQ